MIFCGVNSQPDVGLLGEQLVSQWLASQGWEIVARRWRCRWGEIDLVARLPASVSHSALLTFVEVKVRGTRNWDANGLLAITPQKQAKLQQAAHLFLVEHAEMADVPCRFDVALVRWWASPRRPQPSSNTDIQLKTPVAIAHRCFSLEHYIEGAFDSSE